MSDILERVAVYFDQLYADAPELNPASDVRQEAYELKCWRMLAAGEIPERMTAEQYAFSQERLAREDE